VGKRLFATWSWKRQLRQLRHNTCKTQLKGTNFGEGSKAGKFGEQDPPTRTPALRGSSTEQLTGKGSSKATLKKAARGNNWQRRLEGNGKGSSKATLVKVRGKPGKAAQGTALELEGKKRQLEGTAPECT
jgi:hypothetical protein